MIATARPIEQSRGVHTLFGVSAIQRERRDERLLSEAKACLETTGYRELTHLDCEVIDGLVVLEGAVSSYYLKQLAQEAVLRLDEADGVRNLVSVHWPDSF